MVLNLLDGYAIDKFLPIAKWLVIGVVVTSIIFCVVTLLLKKNNFGKTVKKVIFCLFCFLSVMGIACLIMEITKKYSASYAIENWLDRKSLIQNILIPICSLFIIFISSAITIVVVSKSSSEENKKRNVNLALKICGSICLVGLIICGIFLARYYDAKIANDGYYNSDNTSVNQPILYIASILLIVIIISLSFFLNTNKLNLNTKCIAMAGVCVAMSFGLSYIKIWKMPQGGSITLFSLLPIMIFSYLYGTKNGVLVCLIYGILQAVQDPWIIHPAQFLLDYPIAFSAIGLAGMFADYKLFVKIPQVAFLIGGVFASIVRFVCHLLSGVFAFSAYAEGVNPWTYSLVYNSFVFIDIAITLFVGVVLFSSKAFLKEIKKSTI